MGIETTRQEVEQVVKEWRQTREARLAQEKVAEVLKRQETELKNWLINVLHSEHYEGVVIGGRITSLSEREVPDVLDKDSYLDYVRTTGELDLLQFRPAVGAIKLRLDEGVVVPGVELVKVYDLSDKKA